MQQSIQLSVEISMYPLQEDYKTKIKHFLDELNQHATAHSKPIEIRSSNMSTRIFGDFDAVSNIINLCMKESMQRFGKIVFVCKYLQGDARELKGYN